MLPLDSGHAGHKRAVGVRAAASPGLADLQTAGVGRPGDAGVRVAARMGEVSPYAMPLEWLSIGVSYIFGSRAGAVRNYDDVPAVASRDKPHGFGPFLHLRKEMKSVGGSVGVGFDWQAIPYSVYELKTSEWSLVGNGVDTEILGHIEFILHGHLGKFLPFGGAGVRGVVRNLGFEPNCVDTAGECYAPKLREQSLPLALAGVEARPAPWLGVVAAAMVPFDDVYVHQGLTVSVGIRLEAGLEEEGDGKKPPEKKDSGSLDDFDAHR
ncbi:MAG: hypothetical protein HYT87_00130 [Nitrospirae bacterium]|nr:hypothetical protein [Nitrospirota bacterium]